MFSTLVLLKLTATASFSVTDITWQTAAFVGSMNINLHIVLEHDKNVNPTDIRLYLKFRRNVLPWTNGDKKKNKTLKNPKNRISSEYFDLRTFLHYLHLIQVTSPFIIYSHLSFRHVEPCSMAGHMSHI